MRSVGERTMVVLQDRYFHERERCSLFVLKSRQGTKASDAFLSTINDDDDDDVYYYIRWRLKLEGETENTGV